VFNMNGLQSIQKISLFAVLDKNLTNIYQQQRVQQWQTQEKETS
jgi:hypothetical protein